MKQILLKGIVLGMLFIVSQCCKFTIYFDQDDDPNYVMIQAYTAGGVFLVSQDVISNKKTGDTATLGGLGNVWYDIKIIDKDDHKLGAGDGWYCVGGERKLFYSDLKKYIHIADAEGDLKSEESYLRFLK